MKKTLFFGALATLLFAQCGKDKDLFLIQNGSIGSLTKETKMLEIDSIFANDSIVKLNSIQGALGTQGEVEIYEKGGVKLLLLSPHDESDATSTIANIQVFDPRYKTEKGLSPASTFKDIKDNYTIVNMETTINAVVIFLKETDVYITIDKKHLAGELRFDMENEVEASQIPDEAPIKYFMIGWDLEN